MLRKGEEEEVMRASEKDLNVSKPLNDETQIEISTRKTDSRKTFLRYLFFLFIVCQALSLFHFSI